MRLLDWSSSAPAENLACDEALLNEVENGECGEALRFWESPRPFVVLGVSQRIRQEARIDACRADRVPILRRCSAGGCVLQGPGCLNFSLILDRSLRSGLDGVRASYCVILGRVCEALAELGIEARIVGSSDLAVGDLKFSGNAQKRKRRAMLHHGTLLYGMNGGAMARYLLEPDDRPAYRADRVHETFVAPVSASAEALREVIARAWQAESAEYAPSPALREGIASLVQSRYEAEAWTWRR